MNFLNFEKIGYKFAKIMDTSKKDKDRSFIYLDQTGKKENTENKFFSHYESNDKLMLYPNKLIRCVYIFGPSGAGKSTFIKNYWNEYIKLHKQDEPKLYLFSAKTEDVALDNIANRINILEFMENPIEYNDFAKNDMVVFDDCETLPRGPIFDAIFSLMYKILELARSHGVHCIVTNHESVGKHVRKCINESQVITFFPGQGQSSYFLKQYLGFSQHHIRHIEKSGSRICSFYRNYPQTILLDHEIFNMCDTFIQDKLLEEKINKKLKGKEMLKEKIIVPKDDQNKTKDLEKFTSNTMKNLKVYGDLPIYTIELRRYPVHNAFKELSESCKNNEDQLFHFDMIFNLKDDKDRKICLDKDEVINITNSVKYPENIESLSIKCDDVNITKLLSKCLEDIGPKMFFIGDKFHNSQRFLKDILESNGMYSETIKKFLFDDIKKIMKSNNCDTLEQLLEKWSGKIVYKLKKPVGRPKKIKK